MSTYHLQARIMVGPPSALERNEARHDETDSWEYAQTWFREQLAEGFTVWIYDHGHVPLVHGACDYRVIAHERPATTSPSPQTPRHGPADPRVLPRPRGGRPPDLRRVQRWSLPPAPLDPPVPPGEERNRPSGEELDDQAHTVIHGQSRGTDCARM